MYTKIRHAITVAYNSSLRNLMPSSFTANNLIIASTTMLSRVLGLLRDILITHWAGIGHITDAYYIASKIPSFFRKVISEGAMNNILIPVLSQMPEEKQSKFLQQFCYKILFTMTFISIIVIIFSKNIISCIAPGLTYETKEWASKFMKIIFPAITLISINSSWSSYLNYKKKFAASSISSSFINIGAMSLILIGMKFNKLIFLGFGILFGVSLQTIWIYFNIPKDVRKIKNNHQFSLDNKILMKKFSHILLSSSSMQITTLISIFVSSFLAPKIITQMSNAEKMSQVPISLIGSSIGTTLISYLSAHIKSSEYKKARKILKQSIIFSLIISTLVIVFVTNFSYQISYSIYSSNKNNLDSIIQISQYLKLYILMVPAYSLVKIFAAVFFSLQMNKVPMYTSIVQCFSYLALLMFFHSSGSQIILCSLISAYVHIFFLLITFIKKKIYSIHFSGN
ncbi:murein biosynthesis integral membrane protein MurJ [Candidatus Nesciobacter abundans]|nr:lipid II flippase MurJ [Candidatus Nesciobacter abundans]